MEYQIIKINEEELKKLDTSEFVIEKIEIDNNDQYENLCNLLKKVKGKSNEIKTFFEEPKAKAHKNHKDISTLENGKLETLKSFETLAKKSIGDYQLKLEKENKATNPVSAPKVKGISSSDVYKWEIVNQNEIPMTAGGVWLYALDTKAIDALVKLTNGTISIPGIKITKEKSISVKG